MKVMIAGAGKLGLSVAEALLGGAVEGFGGYELGDEEVGAHLLADLAERHIRDVVHRGEADYRRVWVVDI